MTSVNEALRQLRDGNQRLVNDAGVRAPYKPVSVAAQNPFAIVLACADSRVPVEQVFDQGVGDLFVIRVAGNVVAASQIGSIEYAATQLGTPLVVVLGHSHCGAVTATLAQLASGKPNSSPNLRAIIDRIRPAVEPLLSAQENVDHEVIIDEAVRANVLHSANRLRQDSEIIEKLMVAGDLTVVGATYAIETGKVQFLDDENAD